MQHYVFLGLNPSLKDKGKIALHIPLKDDSSFLAYKDVLQKLESSILNKKTYSIYLLESKNETWKSVIEENKYFSSIKEPINIMFVSQFIEILNNIEITSLDVAKYILKIEKCTHLRLQKLLYLTYSKYLKKYNKKLFKEEFFAWKYGPVNKYVFNYFKNIENTNELTTEFSVLQLNDKDKREFPNFANEYENISLSPNFVEISQIVNEIVNEYKSISTFKLVELLHSEDSAWNKTKLNEKIIDESILLSKY